jgi:ubiquinone/menaquinone biosynthesis C-methylase UbiE
VSSSADRFARTAERVAAQQDTRAARLAQQVRDFLQPCGDERALDVGTGAGALAFALAPLVREVVGLDPVPELLELARQRKQPNTEFVEGDGGRCRSPTPPSTSRAPTGRCITSRSPIASLPSWHG